jgi:hypothetical protein
MNDWSDQEEDATTVSVLPPYLMPRAAGKK